MKACDRFLPLLSQFIDDELESDLARETEAHMESCEACRRELESLQGLDGQLSRALVVSDVAAKVETITRSSAIQIVRRSPGWGRSSWISLVAAVAAVLLIAVLPFLSGEREDPNTVISNSMVARLVRSTGLVQVLPPGATDWLDASAESNPTLLLGSRLKTSDRVMCEFKTTAKATIRVNESAELVLRDAKQVELVAGQLWCSAPADADINVDVAVKNLNSTSKKLIGTFRCPSASEIQCETLNDSARYVSVSPANAESCVTIGKNSWSVSPGESVSIDSSNKVDRTAAADSTTKIWQLPLLAVDGRADQELLSLLNFVLAPIGMTKAMHFNEQQIRQLGPSGSIPLLSYAVTEKSSERLTLRRTAVRMASEVADQRAASLLESLQTDSDPYIAELAKATHARILTSRDSVVPN
jgi:Putative zinc-finger